MRIGIDAGGTFTDFVVAHDDGRIETFKLRSTPQSPARVVLEGIQKAVGSGKASVVHGSTVATNALLERKGARTALVTTAGFEDIFEIGRQNRAQLYVLNPEPKRSLLSAEMRLGVEERTLFDGTVQIPLNGTDMNRLAARLRRARAEAVAICFLHSYRNPENEQKALESLSGLGCYVCTSHDVSPEFREYERTATTVLNAYVGPLMDRYLSELESGTKHPLAIMQSSGGLMTAREARNHAVRTLLSGPAGGVVGAVETAREAGFEKILGFDMGGTSTDVSLAEGAVKQSLEASIDGYPIRVPMLDIHTVGAGGGSIARVDEGGLLRVGPQSAGADPGPACYGTGEMPTVTDAHVVLGRIAPDQLLGGAMRLDAERARAAVGTVASKLKTNLEKGAEGILRVANANMERAIRVVSVERGHDPRQFALVAFGGCGGLHACEIADELSICTVLVPAHAGVLSALGMLLADRVRDYAKGVLGRKDSEKIFRELEGKARRDLKGARLERAYDFRYVGQSYELTVPSRDEFHAMHHKLYGYSDPTKQTELVTVRVRAVIPTPKLNLAFWRKKERGNRLLRRVYVSGKWQEIPVVDRGRWPLAEAIQGPALILDPGATTYLSPGWSGTLDRAGNLIARRRK
jgi:N-methylhydantoinase A